MRTGLTEKLPASAGNASAATSPAISAGYQDPLEARRGVISALPADRELEVRVVADVHHAPGGHRAGTTSHGSFGLGVAHRGKETICAAVDGRAGIAGLAGSQLDHDAGRADDGHDRPEASGKQAAAEVA